MLQEARTIQAPRGGAVRIWIVDVGLPGETNQCQGVARAIQSLASCRITPVKLRLRRRFLQPLFRFAMRRGMFDGYPSRRSAVFAAHALFSGLPAAEDPPDVVVSALGRGEMASALLCKAAGAAALQIGSN